MRDEREDLGVLFWHTLVLNSPPPCGYQCHSDAHGAAAGLCSCSGQGTAARNAPQGLRKQNSGAVWSERQITFDCSFFFQLFLIPRVRRGTQSTLLLQRKNPYYYNFFITASTFSVLKEEKNKDNLLDLISDAFCSVLCSHIFFFSVGNLIHYLKLTTYKRILNKFTLCASLISFQSCNSLQYRAEKSPSLP